MECPTMKTSAYLTQIYGENTSRKFKLMCSKVTIGRSLHAEIRLHNPNISRNHCTLNYVGTENGWTITDNKSQNGTFISGRKLKPGETRLLQCGDIIFLGPPSEMPEAFCYDNAFVDDDEYMSMSGHEIIELPERKCPVEERTASKKRSLIKESQDFKSNGIASSSIKVADVSQSKKAPDSKKHNSIMSNKKEILLHKDEASSAVKSIKMSTSSSELSGDDIERQTSHHILHDNMSPSVDFPPSKQLKFDSPDSGYQIHEISSTRDDQAEDSLSLLDVEKNEVIEPSCSGSSRGRKIVECVKDSQTPKERDILKCKVSLLTEKIKKLEESKLDLLKNYEVVCAKNCALDQQLVEVKKLKEDLKSCEQKVEDKVKNELLEKFEEDLICNICTELLIKPTVLDCSHTFCLHCIKEWKKKKNECPICRRRIQTMTPVLTLEHFINKTLSTLTPEQIERRNQLIKERENQPKKAVTPKSKRFRNSRRRYRRPISSVNYHFQPPPVRDDIEIVGERRNNVLPIPIAPLTIPDMYLRIPQMLLDNSGDSFSVYLT